MAEPFGLSETVVSDSSPLFFSLYILVLLILLGFGHTGLFVFFPPNPLRFLNLRGHWELLDAVVWPRCSLFRNLAPSQDLPTSMSNAT